ncbi:MAG: type III pantothenate kinase [Alistipes sp.]|nr:type III pantothenate kinase [Alistipes sp.]
MNLIIDIGNSRAKVVVMDGDALINEYVAEGFSASLFDEIMASYPTISRAIIASTRGDEEATKEVVAMRISKVVIFKPATTPIPLENHYHTPETLGADRLAAAVGAQALKPNCDIMIVDFGTAITIDFVEGGAFKGGNISPGVTTRFRALADYTARLPRCYATDEVLDYGRTTKEAIEQGVMRGVEHEIRGYTETFLQKNGEKCIIFTGGDAKYFVKRIKNTIFADCEPVIFGLNRILNYNAERI